MSRIIDDRFSISENDEALRDEWLARAIYDIHTSQPAEVVDFDVDRGTVDVRLGVMRDIKGEPHSVHRLNGLPVCYPAAGPFKIQFPIEKGSTGMAVFCESSIDTWLENTNNSIIATNPLDTRMHDYSDGVFILGMRQYNKVEGIDKDNMTIEAGDTKITLSPSGKFSIDLKGISYNNTVLDAIIKLNTIAGGAASGEVAILELMNL